MRRVLAAGLLAGSLAACGDRPHDVLIPTAETAPGAHRVDMLVMTTRAKSDTPGQIYSGERAPGMSLTSMVVSIPPESARKVGEIQWPQRLPANPATDFTTVKAAPVDGPGAMAWFSRDKTARRKLLVFVHGYNTSFEDAVYRFAQIVHDSNTDAAPVLFTWPSRAKTIQYVYDRESASYSRTALEELLAKAAASPNVADITVMAHSLGNWVLTEALRQMAIRHGHIPPKIRNVILASPDLDVDVFRSQIADIPAPRPRTTLFVSSDDRALAISRLVAGGVDRLGQIDPDAEPYRSKLKATSDLVVIDLSKVKSGDSFNHDKFASSPEVVRLIGNRLIAGQQVTTADLSLGERISQVTAQTALAVGATAGAIVAAPIAVVDPASRRSYDEQIQGIGDALSNSATAAGTK